MKKKLAAEFIGTYFLVFFGTGAVVVSSLTKAFGHTEVALVFGIVVMALVYTFGHISGAHFNPAVSIAFFTNKDINFSEMVLYCLVQIIGAITASRTLLTLFGNVGELGITQPAFSSQQAFILELILTFALMMVILWSAVHGKAIKSFAGIAVGAMVAVEAMVFGPISGASMNPARSIGPAVALGKYDFLNIYVVATVIGALLAVVAYKLIHLTDEHK